MSLTLFEKKIIPCGGYSAFSLRNKENLKNSKLFISNQLKNLRSFW